LCLFWNILQFQPLLCTVYCTELLSQSSCLFCLEDRGCEILSKLSLLT